MLHGFRSISQAKAPALSSCHGYNTALSPANYVTLGKLLNLSEIQFASGNGLFPQLNNPINVKCIVVPGQKKKKLFKRHRLLVNTHTSKDGRINMRLCSILMFSWCVVMKVLLPFMLDFFFFSLFFNWIFSLFTFQMSSSFQVFPLETTYFIPPSLPV